MPLREDAPIEPRFITKDADLVDQVADDITREAAWWIAVRSRQYARTALAWVDSESGLRPGDLRTTQSQSRISMNRKEA